MKEPGKGDEEESRVEEGEEVDGWEKVGGVEEAEAEGGQKGGEKEEVPVVA